MCDKNCWIYDDCCANSEHINHTSIVEHHFSCEKLPSNDGHVYMINTCPSAWNTTSVQEKCTTPNNEDVLLAIPVTSTETNITYRNMFCATCHNEKKLHFWNVTITYEKEMLRSSGIPDSNTEILHLEFSLDLRSRLRYCIPNVISTCSNNRIYCGKSTNYVRAGDTVYKNEGCAECNGISQYEPYQIRTHHQSKFPDIVRNTGTQFYAKNCKMYSAYDNQECLIDQYLREGEHFHYLNLETIILSKPNIIYGAHEWKRVSNTTIYLCGTFRSSFTHLYFMNSTEYTLFRIASRITIAMLLLTLAKILTSKKLHILYYKIITAMCTALLCNYLNCELINYTSNYILLSISLHYTSLCYSFWSFIAFYDCWYVICCASTKYQIINQRSNTKIFFHYSLLAFIAPLLIVSLSIFLELSSADLVPCDLKPGYGKRGIAFISNDFAKTYLFCNIVRAEYFANLILFVHTLYHIYMNKRKGLSSNIPANYYLLFVKFVANACFLYSSSAWCSFLFEEENRCGLFSILNGVIGGSRGFFFYFAFAFPWKKSHKIFKRVKESRVHRALTRYNNASRRCSEKCTLTDDY